MNVIPTRLPGVLLIEPKLYRDDRGYFLETWNEARYVAAGIPSGFVQDNISISAPGVLRGLHLQAPSCQSKLVGALAGAVWDVAVDVRLGSPTFGRWMGALLSADDHRQLFLPAGFAHGFVVLGETAATVAYKCDAFYAPKEELTILWNDPELGIDWPLSAPTLSPKDATGLRLRDVPPERLPRYPG
jgi:dTDP-4-dehydrorhamnose 3,5-epimerase